MTDRRKPGAGNDKAGRDGNVQRASPSDWPAPTPPVSRVKSAIPTTRTVDPSPLVKPAAQKRVKPRRPLKRRLMVALGKIVVIFVVGSALWVTLYRFVPPPFTLTMVGDVLAGHGATKNWTPIERIDPDMARAAIAAEDSGFCSHSGFDVDSIAAAMLRNAQGGTVLRGGSTISQQTAKNAFLWQGGGYLRKALEAWFTVLIEAIWSKQRIMKVYLNIAETGIGTYGAEAGAQRYFKHSASSLTRAEAARIAAVLPLPKKRAGAATQGFTRRYGNAIARRIAVVHNDGLDSCVR